MGNSKNMLLPNHHPLLLLLFFMFHFNAQLTSSSPSTAHPNSPFLCHPLQSHALLQFKSTFTIDDYHRCGDLSYPKTESWKEGTDCCSSWDGVTCTEDTGHVIELDLSCSQLVGNIHSNNTLFSPHIAPYLKRLNLAYNDFQGSNMSSQFGVKFGPSLTHLNLSNSGFSGNIPSQLPQLSNLVSLDLSVNLGLRVESNRVLENIAHNLTHLRILYLDNCSLSGSFLPSFGDHSMAKLTRLSLSTNNFYGPITSSFCNMTQLLYLDLGDNFLSGTLPSCLFAMPSLEILRLNDNKLYGQIPTSPFKSVNLTILDLSSNNLSGSFDFHVLLDLKKLRFLELSENHLSSFTSTRFNHSNSMPSLRFLYLSSCNLTEFPSILKTLPNLSILDISNNKIQGPIPQWMFSIRKAGLSENSPTNTRMLYWKKIRILDFHSNLLQGQLPIPPRTTKFFSVSKNKFNGEISSMFCSLTSIEVLDLSHNLFAGLIPPCLGNLSWLSVLNLGKNRLHGTIPNTFVRGNSLKYLVLNDNQLRGRLPYSLSYCKNLEVLDVGHNLIEDTFPHWLEILSALQVLDLRSNKFSGSINGFKSNSFFHDLRILDVSNNSLTGRLPTRLIGNLKAMMDVDRGLGNSERYMQASNLDYGFNYYSIVLTVKGLKMKYGRIFIALTTIDFSRNKFEGDIPEVIGKLGSLKGLNLSHNLLTGHIPSSMGDLGDLEWLDLSSNKLVGQIPRELTNLGFLAVLRLSHNQLEGPIPQGKQFNTFENDSYRENPGLCGFPLSKTCKTNEEAPSKNNVDSFDSVSGFSWEGAFVGYGCGIVFGLCMGYLEFSRRSPQWFVRMVERKQ